jgi:class 3 adenylate cyclase/pimeloyl-ACP methyl ester carboxylesterase
VTQGEPTDSEETEVASTPVPARTFASGRYVATRLLGEGGQKRVYLARDTQLDRDVAIAFIKAEDLDETALDRIRREAQTIARLGAQPHVITIFDIGEEEGRPYTVCEYAPGGDLRQELRRAAGPLPIERALAIGQDLCRGLALAHAHGILHRDVKPENVWFAADGSAKLGDFGVAVAFGQSRMTAPGTVLGTAAYMAPERARGSDVDARADLYSLGCVLYELVTGRPPFLGDDMISVVSQHINSTPDAPSEHNREVPGSLDALIVQLLEKAPEDRPVSAVAVIESLSAITSAPVSGEPIRAPAGTLTVLFTDLVDSTELMQRLGDEAAERLRRSHFRALRDAVATRGGLEVKTLGDGLMVVFTSAVDALACAVAMQQAVHAHNQRGVDPRLDVRVGLDVGEPIPHEGDYFGTPVVVAKRLCDRARGGQIVVSELVWRLAGSRGDHTFRDLGPIRLKGIVQPVTAYEVVWEPATGPPAQQAPPYEAPPESLLPPLLAAGEATTFVGRSHELEALRRCWVRACEGRRQLVLLVGEPGIGKTRLAVEFALQACAEGAEALAGRVDSTAVLAYQPFVAALTYCAAEHRPNELRARLGTAGAELALQAVELGGQTYAAGKGDDEGRQDSDRQRLSQTLASLFGETPLAKPTVLMLDDLHRADRSTIELLANIMRRPQQSRLLIIGTYRETDLSPGHPLIEAIADLRRERLFERIPVTGLDEPGVGALVASWAGQHVPEALTRMIHDRTEGNPFFVEEMLRHLAETGAMYDDDGRLRDDLTPAGIPQGVKEVINRRLSRLSERCNSVLTIASVIGREFGIDALARASGLSEDQLLEALEEAVHASVLREVPHTVGRYSFAHALIHEALYDELTTTRRVRLHGQTLQYADNDGVKLAYEVLGGDGPHIIAIGLSNCTAVRSRNWATAQRWERLTTRYHLILYDRRGVGFSSAPERGYSLFVALEDLRAVLDAAGVERAFLWGAADGGPLAIAFAAHQPQRVAGLLLMGTTANCASSDDFPYGIRPAALESFLRIDAVDRGRALSQLTSTRPSPGADAMREVMGRVPRRVWSKVVGGIAADARSLLPQLHTPTLIVHDPDNNYIPVGAAHYLHQHIPGSQLLITEEYEPLRLGESVIAAVEAFVEGVTADRLP